MKICKPTSNELYEAAVEIERLRETILSIDQKMMKLAMKRKEVEMLLGVGTQRFAQLTGDKDFGAPMIVTGEAPAQSCEEARKIGFLK